MRFNLFVVVSTNTVRWVFDEQFVDEVLNLFRPGFFGVLVKEERAFDDALEHFAVVFVVEGWAA